MSQTTHTRILQVAAYIEAHAEQALPLEHLAQKAALSDFHFQRQFKELMGITPKQFQNAIRIQKLRQALRDGRQVLDAIYEAGFGSSSRVYEQLSASVGVTPSELRQSGKGLQIYFTLRHTDFGYLLMAATHRGVCNVQFGESFTALVSQLHEEFPQAELLPTPAEMESELDKWMQALERHLQQGGPQPQVPIELFGTAFQIKVWQFLSRIPAGQSRTYKQVAQAIGAPNSHRAVANACGANRVGVLIPCHRVLRGDGSLGGYRWGEQRKRQLLELEQAGGR
ncbi:bifunctional transcriptional activator/DNA repair enzyme AdaA [Bowmanella dokdonensis]|uniref:methylated-DNA--[protein]-cysteine S-methyltransferase n=1 Tax=Bowmanella dokdonensis TaxID=751969 RepID=A0A939IMJ0_9ALTE|nr:methylated-DNA--[protein]-cysteine S-methyltransferase [Bowmanella dokdonensis]MBN7825358.1 methylated-DNA--[protein]-cysteine S-methyltransferase [Bowmanella dokdonensis]